MAKYPYGNVFHCCTHKSASQWFRAVLADSLIQRHTELPTYHYLSLRNPIGDPRPIMQRTFDQPFPPNTAVVSLYTSYAAFRDIPKPLPYKAFFVMRDPRDILVSWYYSIKYSHPVMQKIPERRAILKRETFEDGLLYLIDEVSGPLSEFSAQRSWAENAAADEQIRIFRYEDLFGPRERETMHDLFCGHLQIPLSDDELDLLLDNYSFKRISGGRLKGEVDNQHHYRRGVPGAWKEELTPRVVEYFAEKTDDLLSVLGYDDYQE